MNEPIRANVVGGPIEMRDYDHLNLALRHTAVLPDGTTIDIPPGTKLIPHYGGGGPGVTYQTGIASKANRDDHPAPPAA